MSPDATARWRSFCGIFLIVTSRPFFLKMPAWLASVSGANPVHPEMPMATFTSCATAGADTRRAAGGAGVFLLMLAVFLLLVFGLVLFVCLLPPGRSALFSFLFVKAAR